MTGRTDATHEGSAVEVAVDRLATGGEGVGRLASGSVVFVRGALPGERVSVDITEQKKRFARADVNTVVTAATARVEPGCRHAADGSCGGCDWMHVDAAAQRSFKVDLVVEQLQRLGGIDVPTVSHRVHDAGKRTTVRCLITNGRAGYRSRGSHSGFAAASCEAAHPLIEEMIVDGRFGNADEVTLRVSAATGERMALLHGAGASPREVQVPDDVRVAHYDNCDELHMHEEVAGRRWRISAKSFFQTSQLGAEALVASVADSLGEGSVIDLYAGVGLLGTAAGDRLVAAVESSPSSVADAQANLGPGVEVVKAKVERWTPRSADVVIADPARRGLSKHGCAAVSATGARRLVLVSCDPASLGRDASLLAAEHGWQHRFSEVIDMFPDSSQIEAVSLFER